MVFPSPMPSYREPWPHQPGNKAQMKLTAEQQAIASALSSAAKEGAVGSELYTAAARRGLIKVAPAPRSLASHIASGISRTSTVDSVLQPPFATDNDTAITTVVVPRRTLSAGSSDRRRSSSAPPRSSCLSRGGGMLSSGSSVRTVFNNSEAFASLIQHSDLFMDPSVAQQLDGGDVVDLKSDSSSISLADRRRRAAEKVAAASASSNSLAQYFNAREYSDRGSADGSSTTQQRGRSGSTTPTAVLVSGFRSDGMGSMSSLHHTFKRSGSERNARSSTFATPDSSSVSATAPFATEC